MSNTDDLQKKFDSLLFELGKLAGSLLREAQDAPEAEGEVAETKRECAKRVFEVVALVLGEP